MIPALKLFFCFFEIIAKFFIRGVYLKSIDFAPLT